MNKKYIASCSAEGDIEVQPYEGEELEGNSCIFSWETIRTDLEEWNKQFPDDIIEYIIEMTMTGVVKYLAQSN